MKKILFGVIIGLGFTAGVAFAYNQFVKSSDIWDNATDSVKATAKVDSFIPSDGGVTCYVLENANYNYPVGISCVKN